MGKVIEVVNAFFLGITVAIFQSAHRCKDWHGFAQQAQSWTLGEQSYFLGPDFSLSVFLLALHLYDAA